MLSATGDAGPYIIGSAITAAVAAIAALLAFIGNRRGSRDSREIGIIHEAQDYLTSLVEQLRKENDGLRHDNMVLKSELKAGRRDIRQLRDQVEAMRAELAEALRHRAELEQIVRALGGER